MGLENGARGGERAEARARTAHCPGSPWELTGALIYLLSSRGMQKKKRAEVCGKDDQG